MGQLDSGVVVAGVDEVEAVDLAVVLARTTPRQQDAGVVPVAGEAGRRAVDVDAPGDRADVPVRFGSPGPVEGDEVEAPVGEVDLLAHQPPDADRLAAVVRQDGPPGDGVGRREHRVEQRQLQVAVREPHFQAGGLARLGDRGRQPVRARDGAVVHCVAGVAEVGGRAAVPEPQFDGRQPVIALAQAGRLLRHVVEAVGGVGLGVGDAGVSRTRLDEQRGVVVRRGEVAERRAEVHVLEMAVASDAEQVAHAVRRQVEGRLGSDHFDEAGVAGHGSTLAHP